MLWADIYAVQYPGRDRRFREASSSDLAEWAEQISDEVASHEMIEAGRLALFGHSMGALVAYETASVLATRHALDATLLIVAACAAPDRISSEWVGLPDDELVHTIIRLGGPGGWHIRELRELYLPILRSDLQAIADYGPPSAPPTKTAIAVLVGDLDEDVTADDATRWTEFSPLPVSFKVLSGDHFFPHQTHSGVEATIVRLLDV